MPADNEQRLLQAPVPEVDAAFITDIASKIFCNGADRRSDIRRCRVRRAQCCTVEDALLEGFEEFTRPMERERIDIVPHGNNLLELG